MRENMSVVDVVESDSEQNDGQNTVIPVPEKRKKRARCVSIILCTITAILLIAFCVVNRNVVEYYRGPTQKNTTNVCYRKEEKLTFSGLFTTALGLFGVVLGTLVDRLSLIAEERHHLHERYDGSRKKMIKACFSGILWGPVIALLGSTAIILVILIFATGIPWFEPSYLVYIFSGIGVGPLIMHLLNLNTQSKVHISTVLEKKGMFVANGLAWSYYFNYLKQALPKFKDITSRSFPVRYEHIKLSLNKLLLLLPHDCHMTDDFQTLDNKIDKLFDTGNDQESFRFSVYRLTVSEREHKYFVLQYVKEPLKTLREMSILEDIEAVKRQTCEEEVKLLCRTLSRILKDPPDQNFKGKCVVVPIKAKDQESLKNGGLVRCIMEIVQPSCNDLVDGDPRGFVKPKVSCFNACNAFKSNSRSIQTVKKRDSQTDGLIHEVPVHDEQQQKGKRVDSETRNKQDDESNDKKGKKREKILKRKYKNKKSDDNDNELQVIIPAENHDPSHTDQPTSKVQHLVQEIGDGNDSGASTSGNSSEMADTASQQGEQQDDHSSNNTQHQTNTEL